MSTKHLPQSPLHLTREMDMLFKKFEVANGFPVLILIPRNWTRIAFFHKQSPVLKLSETPLSLMRPIVSSQVKHEETKVNISRDDEQRFP